MICREYNNTIHQIDKLPGVLCACDVSMSLESYGKCSKISNTFFFLFSNKMLVFRTGIHKKLVRIANREDPDQTASSEAI